MGVKNLWDILESCKKTLPLHHLQNKRVCVDLSCWIVQLHTVNKSHCPTKDKVYLRGLFHRLRALIALNCSIIFVSDGSVPAMKVSTYRRRLNTVNEHIQDIPEVSSVKRNMGSEFSRMIKEAKLIGMALGIPCLDGIEEAEAQCALLNSEALCDGCYTSDSDAFLFGARTVYRDICLGEGGYVVCYEMDDIERNLGFGRNSLIALAILLGSDYNQRIRGCGPESACKIVKSFGDSVVLQRLASEGLTSLKKEMACKKKDQIFISDNKENSDRTDSDLQLTRNHFQSVINAYLKPKCHSADSDAVHRVLALYPFNRCQLHELCTGFFEWPPEKTDEYILPKIAERSLRRFANLRFSSSQLGVNLPTNEIPVKCPVSAINKQRKIQGRDYYDVSWIDFYSLKASIVPADIIHRKDPGVPSEESGETKSYTQSWKKKSLTGEIDEKLKKLLLVIEQDTPSSPRLKEPTHQDMYQQIREAEGSKNSGGYTSSGVDKEIIDLTSPAPRVKERESDQTDLVELSDDSDEDEDSPQRATKLKELRVFISGLS